MTDQPQANPMESADTPEPMPSLEQTPTIDEGASSTEQVEVSEQTLDQSETLPEGTKERTTEQFEKLKTQLREEREKRQRAERVFQQINQIQPQSPQPQQPYYNPETGQIVQPSRAELMAQQALNMARRAIEEDDHRQEEEAYKAHPDLDPKGKQFNPDLHELAVSYLAKVYASGQKMSLKSAVDKIKGLSKADLKKAAEQGATKALEQLTPKEQASLEATGRSDRRNQTNNLEDLRLKTRHGDLSAIQERVRHSR